MTFIWVYERPVFFSVGQIISYKLCLECDIDHVTCWSTGAFEYILREVVHETRLKPAIHVSVISAPCAGP